MRYLLVGLGNIGRKRQTILGSRCVGTVDPFNTSADYRRLEDCASDRYDAAILAVPNDVKVAMLQELLTQGKHVLVEKPLLLPDRRTTEDLAALAEAHHVVWYTSYNHRFEPLIAEVKRELDKGTLGKLYHGRFFYGNGTVANLAGSWREKGWGVVEDLSPHLLDLVGYLCGERGQGIVAWTLERQEANTIDHCVLATADGRFVLESSFLSWKNDFAVDLYGSDGSLHMRGLCKWGPSELVVYQRVRPSGVPQERRETRVGEDLTWRRDLEYFEQQCAAGCTTADNDWWISEAIRAVSRRMS